MDEDPGRRELEFEWDSANESELARHHITLREVDQVFDNEPVWVRNKVGRLNPDGTLDTSFDPGANLAVLALAIEADGKILVGGNFTTLGDGGTGTTPRNSIGRLTNTDAALEALTVASDGTTITWYRSGASPEVDRVTFELSTDGINYNALATPTRIAGGWQLTGQDLPTRQNIFVRARGFYSTGESDGSDSIVESVRNAFISLSFLF